MADNKEPKGRSYSGCGPKKQRGNEDQCKGCLKWFTRYDLYYGPDPYMFKVFGNQDDTILCDRCYREACESV